MDTRAVYRYITTDLLTGEVLAEIPMQDVSWGRALRRAGEFSGSIPVISATAHLNIYKSTLPGRTALYVLRNDVCVWGGIIWARDYNAEDRTLNVSASEFISYFYHRFAWKSLLDSSTGLGLYAMSQPIQIGSYSLSNNQATITTRPILIGKEPTNRPHLLSVGDEVVLADIDSRLEGGTVVASTPDDYSFTFYTDSDDTIPVTETTLGTFQKSMDNYRFVRDLINRVAEDFAGIDIRRDEYLPGETKMLSIIQKSRLNNVARITTSEPHGLITGQEVVVKDVDDQFDGRYTVTSIASPYAFLYDNSSADLAVTPESGLRTLRITQFSVVGKLVTLTTDTAHSASVGDEVRVDAGRARGDVNITSPDMDIFDETEEIDTIVSPTTFSYNRNTYSNNYWYFERNITKYGLEYQASPEKWIVTLEVDAAHNYLVGGKAQIVGLSTPYDSPAGEGFTITAIPAPNRFKYEIDRNRKIAKKNSKAGVITIFTEKAHGYKPGDTIVISNYGEPANKGYSGTWIIDQVPSVYRFTFKKEKTVKVTGEYAKDSTSITIRAGQDVSQIETGMTVSVIGGSGIGSSTKVTAVNTNTRVVTISDATSAKAERVTASATADNNSNTLVVSVENSKLIKSGMRVSGTGISNDARVTGVNPKNGKISITPNTTAAITGANVQFDPYLSFYIKYGDNAGVDDSPPSNASVKNTSEKEFGTVNKSNGEIVSRTDRITINGGGFVTLGPRAYVGSYGGYASNSDIGISYGEETNAGIYTKKNNFIGSNLQSIGEILEEVSAGPDGFEYRIDCSFDKTTQKFIRKLVLSGYEYPNDPDPKGARSLESLGANKYIFEYPGNIASFSLDESAEDAATRLWVTGSNNSGVEEGSRQPMSAATKQSLLNSGWPVLEAAEQIDGESGTSRLYNQAKSFLEESLPPIDELTVEVNGSMSPIVGSYAPGDWCSLLFEDQFMRERLASSQEPRDDVFVRKIYSFKVDVPDSFGIPEKVSLSLIRDTEVDTYGD